jgi:hypothetical protein
VPSAIWEEISLDFITKLPPSKRNGEVFDSILVVVDRLSKMSLYIPAKETWKANDFAAVFMEHVALRFGLPSGIVSDRGTLFTSSFWTEICYQCQIRRRMSTAYHPQTDGQTERQNQTLEAYLRMFCCDSQSDWASLLKWAEFAYNNTTHSTTKVSPFFFVHGKNPRWSMCEDTHHEGEVAAAADRARELEEVRAAAATRLREAQEQMKSKYDDKHTPQAFSKGDWVLLSTKNLKLQQPSRKMSPKFIGPFEVLEKVGTQAYRLRLPPKYRIHNVFHVSLLMRHQQRAGVPRTNTTAPDLTPEGEEAWEVEKILEERVHKGKKMYLLRWHGYSKEHDSWHTEADFENMTEMLAAWEQSRDTPARKRRRLTNV